MHGSTSDVRDEGKRVIQEQREKMEAGKRAASAVIAAHIVIPTRQRILTDQQVRDILAISDSIGITNCGCRVCQGNYSSPLDVNNNCGVKRLFRFCRYGSQ